MKSIVKQEDKKKKWGRANVTANYSNSQELEIVKHERDITKLID